ncbi:uncharacterized protein LOC130691722 [Daphnia carinata]|uniref:uncharacterized protein LOC130691722 n=1 Tax=Daphnia carinata TaxID=120202 RepID=UPI002580A537|nr:uncharacterized protein LOC130691722 [Daphnia carinata]
MAQSVTSQGKSETVELAKALEHIESALSGVLSRIQQLNEESQQAKTEISQTFGRQLSHLHSRETQLLRQVDVIFRSRGELLQKQLAYCYRFLGALETSRKWSEQLHKYSCDLAIDNREFEEMKKWATSIPLNWTLDENALSKAIANFGNVDMDGVLLLPNSEQSSCLPSRVEEYFEEEHQVLNKPLHSNIIDIKFPKLPKDYSYWLSRPAQQEEKLDSGYGPYRKGTDSYKPCDVQTWLGCLQSETAPEPMDNVSESSPELVTLADTASLNSRDSDSIEIVSISNMCLKFANGHGESGTACHQVLGDFEIENLADNFSSCLKTDKQRWLILEPKETRDIPIAKACRANSVCGSYDACICEINCHDVAQKNREEKEKQENKTNDYRLWLHTASPLATPLANNNIPQLSLFSDDDYTLWLHPDSLACMTKPASNKIPEFPSVFSEEDYRKWLHPESLAGARTSKDFANCLFKYQNLNPDASETGVNSMDGIMTTSASNCGNVWLASSSVNQTSTQHSGLSVSDALNEMRQSSGKLAHVQNSWAQWLKR